MGIAILQATLQDRDALWTFMAEAYGEESPELVPFKFPERWNWQFVANPFIDSHDGSIPVWKALVDGEMAGSIGALPMTLHAGTESFSGGWGCDLIVKKKFRGLGLGRELLRAYFTYFQISVHVSMARSTKKISEQFGSMKISPVFVMWKPVCMHRVFIREMLLDKTARHPFADKSSRILCRYFFLDGFLALAGNLSCALMKLPMRVGSRKSKIEVAPLTGFGGDFTDFITRESASYDVLVHRTPTFLEWKYRMYPLLSYHLFEARKNGMFAGYIVLRMPHPAERNIGIICDLFTARGDRKTVDALVREAVAFFGDRVEVIEALVSQAFIRKTLRRRGFFTLKKHIPQFICLDPELKKRMAHHRDDWFISYADHDLDQIHPARKGTL